MAFDDGPFCRESLPYPVDIELATIVPAGQAVPRRGDQPGIVQVTAEPRWRSDSDVQPPPDPDGGLLGLGVITSTGARLFDRTRAAREDGTPIAPSRLVELEAAEEMILQRAAVPVTIQPSVGSRPATAWRL